MFNNIGKKIKTVTVASFIILCISCIISGIVIMVVDDTWGLYLIFCAPVLLWIGSFYAYGFGELIENSSEIKRAIQNKQPKEEIIIEDDYQDKTVRLERDIEYLEKRIIKDNDYDLMKDEVWELKRRYQNIASSLTEDERDCYSYKINALAEKIERLSK